MDEGDQAALVVALADLVVRDGALDLPDVDPEDIRVVHAALAAWLPGDRIGRGEDAHSRRPSFRGAIPRPSRASVAVGRGLPNDGVSRLLREQADELDAKADALDGEGRLAAGLSGPASDR
jgi:hypothetical protein